jgi:hypothetical protein
MKLPLRGQAREEKPTGMSLIPIMEVLKNDTEVLEGKKEERA